MDNIICDLCDKSFHSNLNGFREHCRTLCVTNIENINDFIEKKTRNIEMMEKIKFKYYSEAKSIYEMRDIQLVSHLKQEGENKALQLYKDLRKREQKLECLARHKEFEKTSKDMLIAHNKELNRLLLKFEEELRVSKKEHEDELRSMKLKISNYEIVCPATVIWEINLVGCSVLKPIVKKRIKNDCKFMENTKDIESYVKQNVKNVKDIKITIKHDAVPIKILNLELFFETNECNICFENQCSQKQKCKVCKYSSICEPCETQQQKTYKKCPFCQTSY